MAASELLYCVHPSSGGMASLPDPDTPAAMILLRSRCSPSRAISELTAAFGPEFTLSVSRRTTPPFSSISASLALMEPISTPR